MTLTPEQIADGWIAHDGGECSVPLDSRPEIMWGDGFVSDHPCRLQAKYWQDGEDSWQHKGPRRHHIIAYRPEPSNG